MTKEKVKKITLQVFRVRLKGFIPSKSKPTLGNELKLNKDNLKLIFSAYGEVKLIQIYTVRINL